MVLLIDGDEYLFRTAAAMECEIEWNSDTWTRHLNIEAAWQSVRSQVKALMKQFSTPHVVFAISGSDNWRKKVLPSYKANRVGKKKPVGYGALRDKALEHGSSCMCDKLEADDVMGIMATSPTAGEYMIVSSDKDMHSIPCALYNPTKDEHSESSVEEADLWHMKQTLTGDTSDGYAGCPKYGPVTADKLLNGLKPEEWWTHVVAAYENAKLDELEALTQARVARILRFGEYDTLTQEVNLWTPKQMVYQPIVQDSGKAVTTPV